MSNETAKELEDAERIGRQFLEQEFLHPNDQELSLNGIRSLLQEILSVDGGSCDEGTEKLRS